MKNEKPKFINAEEAFEHYIPGYQESEEENSYIAPKKNNVHNPQLGKSLTLEFKKKFVIA